MKTIDTTKIVRTYNAPKKQYSKAPIRYTGTASHAAIKAALVTKGD